MYAGFLSTPMLVNHVCMCLVLIEARKKIRSAGPEVTDSHELTCEYWE